MTNPLQQFFRDFTSTLVYPRMFLSVAYSRIRNCFNRDPFFNDFRFQPKDVVDFKIEKCKGTENLDDSKWGSEIDSTNHEVCVEDVRASLEELRRCQVDFMGFVYRADSILVLRLKDGRLVRLALSSSGNYVGNVVRGSAFSNWYCKRGGPRLDSFCSLVSHDPDSE